MFRINVNNNFHTNVPSPPASQLLEEIPPMLLKETGAGPLSPQHSLVLQQLMRQIGLVSQANMALDGKITAVLEIGGLVVALIGGASLAGLLGSPTPLSAGGILLVFGAFFIIVALAAFSATPQEHLVFGARTGMGRQRIYDAYILADFEDSYDRLLADYLQAVGDVMGLNKRKNSVVRLAMLLFLLEVTGVFMAVLGS